MANEQLFGRNETGFAGDIVVLIPVQYTPTEHGISFGSKKWLDWMARWRW